MVDKQFVTAREAADLMGVSLATIYSYLSSRSMREKLGAYKIVGKRGTRHHWRIRINKLTSFLQGNGQSAEAEQTGSRAIDKKE